MKNNKKSIILVIITLVVIITMITLYFTVFKNSNPLKSSNYTASSSIVTTIEGVNQQEVDNMIKSDLEKEHYTLQNAKVYLNPYGNSPLSAVISFETTKEVKIDVTVKGKNGDDLKTSYSKSKKHYIPVYALYQDYENEIVIEAGSESTSIKIKTEKLENISNAEVKNSKLENLNNDLYFITSPISMNSFAYDKYGEVRWVMTDLYYRDIKVLDNGHFLIGKDSVDNNGQSTTVVEMDYLGRIYNEYLIEEGYLNNITVLDNGNFLLSAKDEERSTYSDKIIEIDKSSGKIVKEVDVFELLSQIDKDFTSKLDPGYFYNSGIEYYKDTNTLLLSYWQGEFVISINYKENSINWIFGNPDNFSSNFANVLLTSKDGTYPKGMYSAKLDGDTLTLFDTGFDSNKNDASMSSLKGAYSSANTYKISNKSIELVNAYNENKSLFSYALGDYDVNKDSEVILFGRELVNKNYKDDDLVSDLIAYSKIIEKKNNETILEMNFNVASSTVEKVGYTEFEYNFDNIESYTTLKEAEFENLSTDVIKSIKETTEIREYIFGYSNKIIENNNTFMSMEEAKLVLINDQDKGAVYTIKEKDKSEVKRLLTNLTSGKYYLYIIENGITYKLDKYIEIK